uniref:Reverse transcriptase domain-containing protein n=1 Tax=Tanacetum cinerariifolium TaxID=118510 RepID=A0A6L2LQM8_TANCI|nr:hypothetical protein [Tanacetum cinerariifolium]
MENLPPPNGNPNAPEEEPFMDQAPAAFVGFAPQWIGEQIPNNNNGWLEEEPEEEEEEEEEDEAMEDDDEDDAEVINPYEEANPHNRPPPASDEESLHHLWSRLLMLTIYQYLLSSSLEEPSIHIAPVPRADDPYVMVRDTARGNREDEDVDTVAPWDTQPPEAMPPKRRTRTNPQLTLTQEDVDQLVQDGIAAAIRDERERFHGTEGAVGLFRWFEKMENTFEISECAEVRKVKFATATLHGRALTWWNSQVATLGREVANVRTWAEVKQMMIDEFCPTEEVQRLTCKEGIDDSITKIIHIRKNRSWSLSTSSRNTGNITN